jgi:hypothetical protein
VLQTFGPLLLSGEQFYYFNVGTNSSGRQFFRVRIAP